MSRVHVIAVITAKAGKRDEVLKHFKANFPQYLQKMGASNTALRLIVLMPTLLRSTVKIHS